MATQSNQTRSRGNAQAKRMTAKQREARKKRKIIIFAIEIIILLAMVLVLYKVYSFGKDKGSVTVLDGGFKDSEPEALGIDPRAQDNETLQGYRNIALFGVDANSKSEIFKGSRSDSLMIASINLDTGDIKLVSVYRDTLLNVGDDTYKKCNDAYFRNGAPQAIKMLNSNLDLDIEDFVTVGYQGLSSVIDGLGGIYIDINEEELKHINNYQISISEVLKCEYVKVTSTGRQLLNGLQATAYCRIRYGGGDDFRRAERQREVIKAIEEQAKQASLATLTKAFEDAAGDIYTSLDTDEILGLLKDIMKYSIVDEGGFPEASMRTTGNFGALGSLVVPVSLESNVIWLHEFLFEDETYTVSERVKEYGKVIGEKTNPYIK